MLNGALSVSRYFSTMSWSSPSNRRLQKKEVKEKKEEEQQMPIVD
jgi:hypothetical protein